MGAGLLVITLPFVLVSCFCLRLCGDPEGNLFLDSVYRAVFLKLPKKTLRVTERAVGITATRCILRLCRYLFRSNNCIVQVIYASLVFGGYCAFVRACYPRIGSLQKLLVALSVGGCLTIFGLLSVSDPGVINRSNVADFHRCYQPDGKVYTAGRVCSTCDFEKPARSKHCRLCDHCVAKFDHHCVWIANCIGAFNYRLFLSFLAANLAMTAYGAYLVTGIMLSIVDRDRLWEVTFIQKSTGQRKKASLWVLTQYFLGSETTASLILFLCLLFALMLTAFIVFHFYLGFLKNATTNEICRWMDVGQQHNIYNIGIRGNCLEIMCVEDFVTQKLLKHEATRNNLNDEIQRCQNEDGHRERMQLTKDRNE